MKEKNNKFNIAYALGYMDAIEYLIKHLKYIKNYVYKNERKK